MPQPPEPPPGGAGPDGPTQDEVDRRFAELMKDPDLIDLGGPRDTVGGPRDYAVPDEPEEPFEPPEPEPLESADPIRLLAWTGAIAGPALLLILVMVWPTAPAIVWLTLLAATLVGWGLAFWRLPRSRDDDDDGAVV
jgi:hypothetical protein